MLVQLQLKYSIRRFQNVVTDDHKIHIPPSGSTWPEGPRECSALPHY